MTGSVIEFVKCTQWKKLGMWTLSLVIMKSKMSFVRFRDSEIHWVILSVSIIYYLYHKLWSVRLGSKVCNRESTTIIVDLTRNISVSPVDGLLWDVDSRHNYDTPKKKEEKKNFWRDTPKTKNVGNKGRILFPNL